MKKLLFIISSVLLLSFSNSNDTEIYCDLPESSNVKINLKLADEIDDLIEKADTDFF